MVDGLVPSLGSWRTPTVATSVSSRRLVASSPPGALSGDEPSEWIGKYKVLKVLGEGGMGRVKDDPIAQFCFFAVKFDSSP